MLSARFGGGQVYSECSSNCATPGASWSTLTLPNQSGIGLSIDLAADPNTGLIWRAAALGVGYLECAGLNCATSVAAWSSGSVPVAGQAYLSSVVLDREMLPRIFFTSQPDHGSLTLARCTQRPCSNDPSHWTLTLLATTLSYVATGRAADGRTFFTTNINGEVVVGLETSDGGYDTHPLVGCSGAAQGESPSAVLRAGDKWLVSFATDAGLGCYSDAP